MKEQTWIQVFLCLSCTPASPLVFLLFNFIFHFVLSHKTKEEKLGLNRLYSRKKHKTHYKIHQVA